MKTTEAEDELRGIQRHEYKKMDTMAQLTTSWNLFEFFYHMNLSARRRPSRLTCRLSIIEYLEERALLTPATTGAVANFVEIADSLNGGPDTSPGDLFGASVTSLG